MAESFVVNSDAKDKGFVEFAHSLYQKHKHVTWTYTTGEKNSWPMKKTWRMWMSETAEWMTKNGATMPLAIKADGTVLGTRPFDANDAHELWVRQWLGVDANGERYKTASDDKGQMLHMMNKHVQWAAERGLSLTIPRDGEYHKLSRESES
jgi:hypothetical protein